LYKTKQIVRLLESIAKQLEVRLTLGMHNIPIRANAVK